MSHDPIKDLLDTPDEGAGPSTYWIMSFAILRDGESRRDLSTYRCEVTVEEKTRLESQIRTDGTYFSVLTFADTSGSRQVWYGAIIMGFVESTFEQRRVDQIRTTNHKLHEEKIEKEQRRQMGEWGGE